MRRPSARWKDEAAVAVRLDACNSPRAAGDGGDGTAARDWTGWWRPRPAQCSMWWASTNWRAVQPGNRHPRSRAASARRSAGGIERVFRATLNGRPAVFEQRNDRPRRRRGAAPWQPASGVPSSSSHRSPSPVCAAAWRHPRGPPPGSGRRRSRAACAPAGAASRPSAAARLPAPLRRSSQALPRKRFRRGRQALPRKRFRRRRAALPHPSPPSTPRPAGHGQPRTRRPARRLPRREVVRGTSTSRRRRDPRSPNARPARRERRARRRGRRDAHRTRRSSCAAVACCASSRSSASRSIPSTRVSARTLE